MFLTSASDLPALVADGRVQPVDGLLEERGIQFGDNYERLGLEAMAADSALQCMPNDVSPYVVFYNKRLLDTSLLPSRTDSVPMPQDNGWSWNQFTVAAAQMSRGVVKGVYLPPRLTTLTPLMRSAGSDIVDDAKTPTTLTLSPTPNRNDLERILDVARNQTISLTPRELAKEGPRLPLHAWQARDDGRHPVPGAEAAPEPRAALRRLPDAEPGPQRDDRGRQRAVHQPRDPAPVRGGRLPGVRQRRPRCGHHGAVGRRGAGERQRAELRRVHPDEPVPAQRRRVHPGHPAGHHDAEPAGVARGGAADPAAGAKLFYAQRADFDVLLPRIDQISVPLLAQDTETPSPTESPSGSATGSATGSPGSPTPQTVTPSAASGSPKMTHGPSPN